MMLSRRTQCIERLTSALFHQNVSVSTLGVEFGKTISDPICRAILFKHLLSLADNYLLLPTIIEKYPKEKEVIQKLLQNGCDSGKIEWLSQIFENANLTESFLKNLNCNDFYLVLSILREIPNRVIPIIESQILGHVPENSFQIAKLIHFISHVKLANMAVFELVTNAMIKVLEDSKNKVSPGISLRLIREMGFAGMTNSKLLEKIWPIFLEYKNFQALSSVYMLAGGLTPEVVRVCMASVRSDHAGGWVGKPRAVAPTPQGHAQFIRRLVVCGYPKEAMEVFSHFPKSEFATLSSRNEISQIYRLYLASFLWPEIVDRSAVVCLRRENLLRDEDSLAFKGSSFIHALVVGALNRLGVEHVSEYIEPETLLMIDIYIPSLNLAIEVQGPSHYIFDLRSGKHVMRPEDSFKGNVLKSVGLHVEELSVHEFGRNSATRNADDKISQILSKYKIAR